MIKGDFRPIYMATALEFVWDEETNHSNVNEFRETFGSLFSFNEMSGCVEHPELWIMNKSSLTIICVLRPGMVFVVDADGTPHSYTSRQFRANYSAIPK